jgi:hypothetical protein
MSTSAVLVETDLHKFLNRITITTAAIRAVGSIWKRRASFDVWYSPPWTWPGWSLTFPGRRVVGCVICTETTTCHDGKWHLHANR